MKGEIPGAIFASLLVFASLSVALPVAAAETEGTMYFEPATLTDLEIDDEFTLTVLFSDFTDLYVWQVEIGFDPTVLRVVAFMGGPELPDSVFKVLAPERTTLYMKGPIDNTAGYIYYSAESLTGPGGVTGTPGVGYKLMKINFKVVGFAPGGSEVFMDRGLKTYWVDSIIVKKYPKTQLATISTVYCGGLWPSAKFSWTPVIPKINDTITFDASASRSGFDGVNVCPITEYRWDFNADLEWDVVADVPVTTWSYAEEGFHPVTLEVWAPGNYPPCMPDTDNITKTVQVITPGAYLDVYTSKFYSGVGPDVPCDAFAPQEMVILYALVTYNDDPVPDKLVAFQVMDAADENVIYRTATTDEIGIAFIEFRIPNAPALGTWTIIAIADVGGTKAADTLTFEVGWIIEILSVTPGATSYAKGTTAIFNLETKSISKMTRTPTITVVIYDDAGVPIGKVVILDWAIDPEATTLLQVSINIPTWAFVGPNAVAYANALTDIPINSGTPYCPEASASFIIEKA